MDGSSTPSMDFKCSHQCILFQAIAGIKSRVVRSQHKKRQQQGMKSSLDNANDSNSASVMAKGTSSIKQTMASNVRRTMYDCGMKHHTLTAQLRTDKGKPTIELSKCFEHEPYSPE